jgi:hypothetical protein
MTISCHKFVPITDIALDIVLLYLDCILTYLGVCDYRRGMDW